MKKAILIIIQILLTISLIGQDKYDGQFSKDEFYIHTENKIPIGDHVGFDSDEGITISINYGKQASFKDITVKVLSDTICYEKMLFPINEIEWVEIKKGLWINSINKEERFVDSFDKSDEIKMHYAGFLETGEPFDNSFIRNKPLKGKLEWFISGFSIGAVNVMPNTIRIIKISPELAYGTKGGGNIPPNSTIYYVIYNLENPRA